VDRSLLRSVVSLSLLLGWCGVLFFYGLDAGPLYRTESLRAIIGAESLRDSWLYPVLYGEPFLTKPPGHYAAIALCSLPFGEVTAASARIPSALAATAIVFLMWGMFRRTLGERPAFVAALLLPTSVLWLDKAPSAEIDMTLVGWVTLALVFMYRWVESEGDSQAPPLQRGGFAMLSLLCVAAGTLTKWTAPAFFYLTVVPLLLWRRQLSLLFGWRHLLAVGLAVGLIAAWAAAVTQQVGWETLRDTIRAEAAYRFNPPPKAKGYPWSEVVTYPLLVFAAHLPLSLFALRTLQPSFFRGLDDRARLLVQFLHCWTWPNLLFWALVPNHNVRYALPLSPGLMGLGVLGLLDALRSADSGSRLRWVAAFLVVWLVVKIAFVEVVVPRRTAGRDAEATAARLREVVPPGETLHLLKLKDEGVMFYYGRPVRRLRDPHELPRPGYLVLIRREWDDRAAFGDAELVRWMYDQQGDPLILVKLK
jgi:4-amino-4-deoxy-L-arabinose transferase-like glycosyltransferase